MLLIKLPELALLDSIQKQSFLHWAIASIGSRSECTHRKKWLQLTRLCLFHQSQWDTSVLHVWRPVLHATICPLLSLSSLAGASVEHVLGVCLGRIYLCTLLQIPLSKENTLKTARETCRAAHVTEMVGVNVLLYCRWFQCNYTRWMSTWYDSEWVLSLIAVDKQCDFWSCRTSFKLSCWISPFVFLMIHMLYFASFLLLWKCHGTGGACPEIRAF